MNIKQDLRAMGLNEDQISSHATDLYIRPENQEQTDAIADYLENNMLRFYIDHSDVEGQSWYGKSFFNCPFALIDDKIREERANWPAPRHSPWGTVQESKKLCDGVFQVYTSSHGGINVHRKLLSNIPKHVLRETFGMQGESGWFEEDCDWCIPFVFFENEIKAFGEEHAMNMISNGRHLESFKNNHTELFNEWEQRQKQKATAEA